jgi:hypothetical protein
MGRLAPPTHDIVLWLSGYYNGKRNNMIINFQTIENDEEKVRLYCYHSPETTVLEYAPGEGRLADESLREKS